MKEEKRMKEYKGREEENRTLVLNHGVDDTKHTHTHTLGDRGREVH